MGKSSTVVSIVLGVMFGTHLYAEATLIDFDKPHVPNQYIVRLKADAEAPRSMFRQAGVTPLHAFTSSPAYLVQVDSDAEQDPIEVLRQNPDIASIQVNRIFTLLKTPNDPSYTSQYHHTKIASTKAWDLATGSKNVIVGIIDSGVNYSHPDIAPNYWTNPGESGVDANGNDKRSNGVDDDGNGYVDDFRGWDFFNNDNDPMDDNGHGTHCAGIIGAKGDNGRNVVGVNWDISLVGLKFIDGKTGQGDLAGAVKAIEYATAMGIGITNNSWGAEVEALPGPDEEDILRDAIKAAGEKGYLFVAAAGNSSSNNDKKPTLPASYGLPNIISVAATGTSDNLASFSNFGPQTVDIAAPGSNILSTVLGNRTMQMSGTSMAAPVVTGAAALLQSVAPNLTAVEIKARLLQSVDPVASLQGRVISGGRLNVAKALQQ
jgi:thermitase